MNGSKRVYLGFTALALPWLLAGSTAIYADDDATFNRTPRDCVITQSISRTVRAVVEGFRASSEPM